MRGARPAARGSAPVRRLRRWRSSSRAPACAMRPCGRHRRRRRAARARGAAGCGKGRRRRGLAACSSERCR
eukprot:5733904-Prymnesium_polylepis.1